MPDILNHQPAKPATSFPGRWLLDLPSTNTQIHIRRYRAISRDDPKRDGDNGPSDASTIIERLKSDPLEAGWKRVNSVDNPGGGGAAVRRILAPGQATCGVIICEDPKDPSGNAAKQASSSPVARELWCFHLSSESSEEPQSPFDEADELEEITPHLPALSPKQLITCPQHGHDLSCLQRIHVKDRATRLCDVRFDLASEEKLLWDRFTNAVVEKIAWAQGRRIEMGAEFSALKTSLYPLPGASLLLKIQPRMAPACISNVSQAEQPQPVKLPRHCIPLRLRPLDLPGILVRPHEADPAELVQLTTAFEAALGHDWKRGQSSQRISRQIDGRPFHEFSLYWVPTAITTTDPASSSATQLASEWRKGQGVFTVWPTHLATEFLPVPTTTVIAFTPPVTFDTPSCSELMNTASSIFDFLSTYREPEPEVMPEDEPTDDLDLALGAKEADDLPLNENTPVELDHTNNKSEGLSDFEDLFSSSSHGNTPNKIPQTDPFDAEISSVRPFLDSKDSNDAERILDFDDIVMASPLGPARVNSLPTIPTRNRNEPEAAVVTEDDFNFFDSPMEQTEAEHSVETPQVNPEEPNSEAATEAKDESVTGLVHDDPRPLEPETINDSPTTKSAKRQKVDAATVGAADKETIPSPVAPLSDTTSRPPAVSFALPSPDTPSFPAEKHDQDLVPDAFEPLDLPPSMTNFAYSLPSPALTPEALKTDLIERLKPPDRSSKKAFDYAASWRLDTPPSDDEEEEYTAPPTPETDTEFDMESTNRHTPMVLPRDTHEADVDGLPYIGAEWVSLIGQTAEIDQLGRPWNSAWSDGSMVQDTTVSPTKVEKRHFDFGSLDTDYMAREILANRSFRHLVENTTSLKALVHPRNDRGDQPLIVDGTSLADITQLLASNDNSIPDLRASGNCPPCAIHTGLAGNVTKLSIASLRFWRELGLQPLSGPKNARMFAIVDAGKKARPACVNYLERMSSAYKTLNLGVVEVDEKAGKGGVVIRDSGNKDFIPHAARLILDCTTENTVIQVFANDTKSWSQVLFSTSITEHLQQNSTIIIQLLPISTIKQIDLDDIAFDAYNRLHRQIKRVRYPHPIEGPEPYFHYPSFTLAPDQPPKAKLTLSWPLKSYDVFGTWRWIHLAYSIRGGWLVALVIDAEGDNWEVKTWDWQSRNLTWSERIERVWSFAEAFAESAAIQWRLSLTSLGLMEVDEWQGWRKIFLTKPAPMTIVTTDHARSTPSDSSDPPEPPRPKLGPPNAPAPLFNDPSSRIIDESLSGHCLELADRHPVTFAANPDSAPLETKQESRIQAGPEVTATIYTEASFLLSLATDSGNVHPATSALYHIIHHRPAPGMEDEVIGQVLGREFYRIGCLVRLRMGRLAGDGIGHVGAVEEVLRCFAFLARQQDPRHDEGV